MINNNTQGVANHRCLRKDLENILSQETCITNMNTDDLCAVIKITVNTKIKVKYITYSIGENN